MRANSWRYVTPALLRVMEAFSRGLTYREIAFELSVKDETVKTYARSLRQIFDIPPGKVARIVLAMEYLRACENELFSIGSDVLRSQ